MLHQIRLQAVGLADIDPGPLFAVRLGNNKTLLLHYVPPDHMVTVSSFHYPTLKAGRSFKIPMAACASEMVECYTLDAMGAVASWFSPATVMIGLNWGPLGVLGTTDTVYSAVVTFWETVMTCAVCVCARRMLAMVIWGTTPGRQSAW
ncbi:hypothetical protein K439DRAFT_1612850 [Ramaria rubella]|nr:hypothetical protein K439DRAFT_1612850 [Ramaria rubella]